MANRIAVMVDGRIVQIGPPRELYNEPCDVRVAEMLGNPSINLIDGHVLRDHIDAGGLRLPMARRRHARGLRPEAAQCLPCASAFVRKRRSACASRAASSGRHADHAANATVARTEHLGAEAAAASRARRTVSA